MAFLVALLLALFVLPYPVELGGDRRRRRRVELAEAWFWWWLSHRRQPAVGVETLVGARGDRRSARAGRYGQVRVRGEIWQARCDGGLEHGAGGRQVTCGRAG